MKKLLLSFLFVFLGTLVTQAQNDSFYYYHGEKIPLTIDKTSINVFTDINFDSKSIEKLGFSDFEFTIEMISGIESNSFGDNILIYQDAEHIILDNQVEQAKINSVKMITVGGKVCGQNPTNIKILR